MVPPGKWDSKKIEKEKLKKNYGRNHWLQIWLDKRVEIKNVDNTLPIKEAGLGKKPLHSFNQG